VRRAVARHDVRTFDAVTEWSGTARWGRTAPAAGRQEIAVSVTSTARDEWAARFHCTRIGLW